jgi:hypothetical protein
MGDSKSFFAIKKFLVKKYFSENKICGLKLDFQVPEEVSEYIVILSEKLKKKSVNMRCILLV